MFLLERLGVAGLVTERERRKLTGRRREGTGSCRFLGHGKRRIHAGRRLVWKTFENSWIRAHFKFGVMAEEKANLASLIRLAKKLNPGGKSRFTAKTFNFRHFPPATA
jgi:hypothetical protein